MKHWPQKFLFFLIAGILWGSLPLCSEGQEIDFSVYSDYGISIVNMPQDLVFGEGGQVLNGEGTVEIPLSSGDKTTIVIEGVKYLDIIVDIQGTQEIYKNGDTQSSQQIPLDLDAAYANLGNDNYAQARFIPLGSNNSGTVRFRVQGRGEGPPAPPPTPPHEGYTPPKSEAYLYLYGSIDVGDVDAGDYSTTVTVTVSYAQSN